MIVGYRQVWLLRGLLGLGVAGVVICLGCEAPQGQGGRYPKPSGRSQPLSPPEMIDPTTIPTRDDIVAIYQFWPNVPWLLDSGRPVGFRVTTYFVSGETERGAFVPGTIFAWLYRLEWGPDGKRERVLAHVWEFDQAAAMGYRVRKEAIGGYHYGFALAFPPTVDIQGQLVEIEFGYERRDKTVVTGPARRFQAPVSTDYRRPQRAETP